MASAPQPLFPDKEGGNRGRERWRAAEPIRGPPRVGFNNFLMHHQVVERVRGHSVYIQGEGNLFLGWAS
eukprot:4964831-Pyramimonas_sp.AAC.1